MTSTLWLGKDVKFQIGNTTIDDLCVFIDSGDFALGVIDADAAKNLIIALSDAVERLEKNGD